MAINKNVIFGAIGVTIVVGGGLWWYFNKPAAVPTSTLIASLTGSTASSITGTNTNTANTGTASVNNVVLPVGFNASSVASVGVHNAVGELMADNFFKS